jgi:hypothetical protein
MNVTSGVPVVVAIALAVDGEHPRLVFERGLDGMRGGHLTELGRERDLLLGRERLIGEEEHQVLEPGAADRRDHVGVERASRGRRPRSLRRSSGSRGGCAAARQLSCRGRGYRTAD